MMRLTAYAGSSVVLATGVLLKALNQRVNFYSASVYLSQSNACVIVLVNLLVLLVGTLAFGLQRLLYGPLRPIEAEQLYDRAWFAVTETCLAMTMFREEIGVWFVLLFISLLVGKAWSWIGEGRVEILDQQPPANPRLFHARLSISLVLSLVFDVYLLDYAVSSVRHQARPTMMVMFAFEFAVLTAGSVSTALRYLISLREAAVIKKQTEQRIQELREARRREAQEAEQVEPTGGEADGEIDETEIDVPGWEDKGRWVFYLELLTDLVRLILYLTFFCVLCVFYGLPIYIIRDVAMAIRSFYKRITDFVKYKHATRDMNERYPDATADDIRDSDVCIICREGMTPWQQRNEGPSPDQRFRPKKLPCGHILHFACLRSWLERQQICPTCRQPVIGGQPAARQPQNAAAPDAAARQRPAQNREQAAGPQAPQPDIPPPDLNPRPQADHGNGWRRFQLGPLRLDVGAWQGQAPPVPGDQPQRGHEAAPGRPAQRTTTPSLTSGQNRFARPIPGPATAEATTMQMQIDLMEQQVLQQINSLRVTVNHISRVRASQEELIRLHGLQHGGAPPSVQVFRSDPSRRPLQAGSEGLPAGLVLPEGWSLLPLGRSASGSTQTGTALDGRPEQIPVDGQTPVSASGDNDSQQQPQQGSTSEPRTDISRTTQAQGSAISSQQTEVGALSTAQTAESSETQSSETPDLRRSSVTPRADRQDPVASNSREQSLPQWGSTAPSVAEHGSSDGTAPGAVTTDSSVMDENA